MTTITIIVDIELPSDGEVEASGYDDKVTFIRDMLKFNPSIMLRADIQVGED